MPINFLILQNDEPMFDLICDNDTQDTFTILSGTTLGLQVTTQNFFAISGAGVRGGENFQFFSKMLEGQHLLVRHMMLRNVKYVLLKSDIIIYPNVLTIIIPGRATF